MAIKKKLQLVPQCPHCNHAGPMSLVVSTTTKWKEEGSPVIQCTNPVCARMYVISEFLENLLNFFKRIEVVEQ